MDFEKPGKPRFEMLDSVELSAQATVSLGRDPDRIKLVIVALHEGNGLPIETG